MIKKPNFFQVGQPKSGTVALHNFLDQHPMIFMSTLKEPLYFCKDFQKEAEIYSKYNLYKFAVRTEKEYTELFANAKGEKVLGESTNHYLYSKVAAREIHRFNPNAKILIMLRDPVDFLHSYYSQCVVQAVENENDFRKALSLEESRRKGRNVPYNAVCPSFLYYSERVKYYEQVKRYIDLFDNNNIKIVIYEDFRNNNPSIYREILAFLEVDSSFVPNFKEFNPSQKPRNTFINNIVFNPKFRRALQITIPDRILENSAFKTIAKNILRKKQLRNTLDESLRHELMRQYRPEIVKISELIGINLVGRWGYNRI